ncbi:MAG: hypothetical protein U0T78_04055 [Cloacibacterium normanense]
MKKEIGLVLSGGGTKGIAEAGALKFLEEKYFSRSHCRNECWCNCRRIVFFREVSR